MKNKIVLFLLISFQIGIFIFSDRSRYYGEKTLIKKSKEIIIVHHHNWANTFEKLNEIEKKIGLEKGIFSELNDFSYVAIFDISSGKILFKQPSPPFTYFKISKDSKYFIGLSYIKYQNPFNIVLYNHNGRMIFKKYLNPEEARLNYDELKYFKKKFTTEYENLIRKKKVIKNRNYFFIDFLNVNFASYLGRDACDFLFKKLVPSHYSNNFSQTTSNYLFFYYGSVIMDKSQAGKDPDVKFIYNGGELEAISMLDPKGMRFEIPLKEDVVK